MFSNFSCHRLISQSWTFYTHDVYDIFYPCSLQMVCVYVCIKQKHIATGYKKCILCLTTTLIIIYSSSLRSLFYLHKHVTSSRVQTFSMPLFSYIPNLHSFILFLNLWRQEYSLYTGHIRNKWHILIISYLFMETIKISLLSAFFNTISETVHDTA